MLPGGDPLAEALAAGETPSPEMVANAGSDEGLSLKVSIPTLAGIAAILIIFCIWYPKTQLLNRIPLENSPEVLAAKARDLVRSFGFTDRPADTAGSFLVDTENLQYMKRLKTSGNESSMNGYWTRVLSAPPSPLFFWYRQSPAPMAALNLTSSAAVNPGDPPMTTSGMVYIAMEPDGRLKWLRAVASLGRALARSYDRPRHTLLGTLWTGVRASHHGTADDRHSCGLAAYSGPYPLRSDGNPYACRKPGAAAA
jgi:hypothetical protein